MSEPMATGRAPRLSPAQRIAPHITRVGRFRRLDPAKGTRPPSKWALLGRAGWAVLVEESLRRAWKRSRRSQDAAGSASPPEG